MSTHGFELIRDEQIPELNTRAKLYRHIKTGAELLSMENSDENKVFGITFRTPPEDSTGIAHILEHSVLNGSRKFPTKEPFVMLVKASLASFVNASTYPDKTMYPVASQNTQDFYNLVDVYLDAVFHPLISPQILQQEGWHFELESAADPLIYKGVVFNEMKGANSSPERIAFNAVKSALMPQTIYANDSGGDPRVIPNLTYEQFKKFHTTYYHPSNAMIWFWGDDDPERRLALLDEYLREFERAEIDATIKPQASIDAPRRVTEVYDAGTDPNAQKLFVMVNWLLSGVDRFNTESMLTWEILNYILRGTPASPLRKALIDSRLGEDLAGFGFGDWSLQPSYSVGLRGVAAEDANIDLVEGLVLKTLGTLAEEGIDPGMVEAAMNTTEFSLRELNTGGMPRGLALMGMALDSWNYGGDPLANLAYEKPLSALKERLARGEKVFETLIAEYLLSNPHRVTVTLTPDPDLRARLEREEVEKLAQIKAGMTDMELQEVIEITRALKLRQATPDTPKDLAKIPVLKREDLERHNKITPIDHQTIADTHIVYHDLFTNGIVYLDLGFDLHALPQEQLPYIRLFNRALLEMGTATEDYVKLSQRIGQKTGGIRASQHTAMRKHEDTATPYMFLRAKATPAQAADMFTILRDVLLTANLDNVERFRQIVLEEKAGKEASLIPSGHVVVATRMRAQFNESDWLNEQMSGIEYLFFLRRLAEQIDSDWASVHSTLESMRHTLITRGAMIGNVTLDAANYAAFRPQLESFLSELPNNPTSRKEWTRTTPPTHEGLIIPAQVNYVGKGADVYNLGYSLHGSSAVALRFLRLSYLWDKIRVQGGAYGAFVNLGQYSGVLGYGSYRDPNLVGTLDVYDQAPAFLRAAALDDAELVRNIIGTIGTIDDYKLPDAKGFNSLTDYLSGESDEERQRYREQVLDTSIDDLRQFADVLDQVRECGSVVVLGSESALQAANAARAEKGLPELTLTKVM